MRPSVFYSLGTDKRVRDVLSPIIQRSSISLLVESLAIFLGVPIRPCPRLLAGYSWELVNGVILRVVEIKLVFPSIL